MKKTVMLAALAATMNFLASVTAFAAEYVWIGNADSSWSALSSYTLNGATPQTAPTAGDTVSLPANSSATVDNDSIAYVGALSRIKTASKAVLYVNITTNAVMGCTIAGTSTSSPYGTLVKSGAGTLTLSSANGFSSSKLYLDCFTALSISGGSIVLPQGASALSTSKAYQLGTCTVAEGCTLWLPDTCDTYMTTLNGAGIVTNTSSRTLRLNGSGVKGAFSGAIGGANLAMEVYYGAIDLTGNSISTKNFGVNGADVGVSSFGSPLGLNQTVYVKEKGGTFRYLGSAPETVEKEFSIYYADSGAIPFTFDGGAYGGLTITGNWSPYNNRSNPARMRRIVLTGSNEVECVAANAITTATAVDDGTNYSFSVTKKGSGVWRLANHASRTFTGSVAVDEGTLRFDSIDETNVVCSLGRARDLFGDHEGVKDEAYRLPYAIRLGSAEAEGVFEYTGTGFAQTKTRAIALAGDARIVHNGTAGFIRLFSGLSSVTAGAKTLTLDGNGTVDCEISNISDGSGVVSVVKEGDGIWALTGEQSFSGSLHVKKGTLYLRNPDRYNWFRFVIRENLGSAETRLYELGLFDSEAHRVALTPVAVYDTDKGSLQYGEAALWRSVTTHSSGPFSSLFDENGGSYARFQGARPQTGSESTWIYIAMRVPADANVAAFDYAPYVGGSSSAYIDAGLKSFVMQGSLDGVKWVDIYEETDAQKTSNAKWHYTGNSVTVDGLNSGKAIDTTIPVGKRAARFLDNVSEIQVDAGATLALQGDVTLSRLTVDLAGAGTISGGAMAETGRLEITGTMSGDSVAFPVTFSGVSGVENLLRWDVMRGGELASGLKVVMVDNTLRIKSVKGFSLMIR